MCQPHFYIPASLHDAAPMNKDGSIDRAKLCPSMNVQHLTRDPCGLMPDTCSANALPYPQTLPQAKRAASHHYAADHIHLLKPPFAITVTMPLPRSPATCWQYRLALAKLQKSARSFNSILAPSSTALLALASARGHHASVLL